MISVSKLSSKLYGAFLSTFWRWRLVNVVKTATHLLGVLQEDALLHQFSAPSITCACTMGTVLMPQCGGPAHCWQMRRLWQNSCGIFGNTREFPVASSLAVKWCSSSHCTEPFNTNLALSVFSAKTGTCNTRSRANSLATAVVTVLSFRCSQCQALHIHNATANQLPVNGGLV